MKLIEIIVKLQLMGIKSCKYSFVNVWHTESFAVSVFVNIDDSMIFAPFIKRRHWIIFEPRHEKTFMLYVNNKDADQPAHPRSLISILVIRCLDSIMPPVSISEISSLYLAPVAAQAGLSLPWSQTPKTGFLMTRFIFIGNKTSWLVYLQGNR